MQRLSEARGRTPAAPGAMDCAQRLRWIGSPRLRNRRRTPPPTPSTVAIRVKHHGEITRRRGLVRGCSGRRDRRGSGLLRVVFRSRGLPPAAFSLRCSRTVGGPVRDDLLGQPRRNLRRGTEYLPAAVVRGRADDVGASVLRAELRGRARVRWFGVVGVADVFLGQHRPGLSRLSPHGFDDGRAANRGRRLGIAHAVRP